jgi:hypothetical protein
MKKIMLSFALLYLVTPSARTPVSPLIQRLSVRFPRLMLGLSLVLLSACTGEETVSTAGQNLSSSELPAIELTSLSTRSWLVTGGDVLVAMRVASDSDAPSKPSVRLNGDEVGNRFVQISTGHWQANLSGLPLGDSLLEAEVPGSPAATLRLTNYPVSGPIISGEHESPFYCQTEDFVLVAGGTLGPALDSNCFAETRVDYVYKSLEDNSYKPYPPAEEIGMEDVALITNSNGEEVPYIVRVETGVVNRAIYEIAMLHHPDAPEPTAFSRSSGWNGKLVYTHGGGCRSGWYQQGDSTGGVMRDGLFQLGYATVSSTLNVFGQNCNDLLASETHIMVKERFIERYGVPIYTIATGTSGGSYQSHQTADNYPGVFDGIIVGASFPDVASATIFTLADARLLNYYFTDINPGSFSREQQRAVSGFGSWGSIANLARGAARLDPLYEEGIAPEEQGGEVSLPELEGQRYDPATNSGIRATVYDHTVNVYGRIDGTDVARRPLDNVGVQYGLGALNNGLISPDQFIALNRDIGGFDYDMNHVAERHRSDQLARARAIETGRILYGGAGLSETPIIDYRRYTDHVETGDIHMVVHQFSTRQRLVQANGHAENHVMNIGGRWGFDADNPDLATLFLEMDNWLMAIAADSAALSRAEKVVRNKPPSLVDVCWDQNGDEPLRIEEEQTFIGNSACNTLYPAYPTPRHVAGAPLANNIVSCRLRPLNVVDYAVSFSDEQWQQLLAIFPDGVCDWSAGDVSGARHQGVWASFGPSPVNRLY